MVSINSIAHRRRKVNSVLLLEAVGAAFAFSVLRKPLNWSLWELKKCHLVYFAHPKCGDNVNKAGGEGKAFLECQKALPRSSAEVRSGSFSFPSECKEIVKGAEK